MNATARKAHRLKVGIVGCGAIGSGIATAVEKRLKKDCQLTALYDIDDARARSLENQLSRKGIVKKTLEALIENCDVIVEAVNAKNTTPILRQALEARKSVIAMSVGKLLNASSLFRLAHNNHCHLLLPSGAVAGIDAIKAASLASIRKITLTTRKPPSGFLGNDYLLRRKINPAGIKKETVLYQGGVDAAVKLFPQNINVAATIALASRAKDKITVCIMTSPDYVNNSHEIEVAGDFGRITTRTDNVVCPDNPKTSYLAVLSGIQTLKQYCQGIFIGT